MNKINGKLDLSRYEPSPVMIAGDEKETSSVSILEKIRCHEYLASRAELENKLLDDVYHDEGVITATELYKKVVMWLKRVMGDRERRFIDGEELKEFTKSQGVTLEEADMVLTLLSSIFSKEIKVGYECDMKEGLPIILTGSEIDSLIRKTTDAHGDSRHKTGDETVENIRVGYFLVRSRRSFLDRALEALEVRNSTLLARRRNEVLSQSMKIDEACHKMNLTSVKDILSLRDRKEIISILYDGYVYIPSLQFVENEDGYFRTIPGIEQVLKALDFMTPVGVVKWLDKKRPQLGGLSPVEALRVDMLEPVMTEAYSAGAHGAYRK